MILEVCAESIQSCLNAQKGGAYRIELCSGLSTGGLTPSSGLIQMATQYTTVPVYVLIRPRQGDFEYSRVEIEVMKRDIENCKAMGASGVVFGMLNSSRDVDFKLTRDLVNIARPLDVTFHRAFDMCADPFEALETIHEAGCSRILTSGQKPKALEGIELISQLCDKGKDRVSIMCGGGVNAEMIPSFYDAGVREFHMSASVQVTSSKNGVIDEAFSVSDTQSIKAAKEVIKSIRKGSRS